MKLKRKKDEKKTRKWTRNACFFPWIICIYVWSNADAAVFLCFFIDAVIHFLGAITYIIYNIHTTNIAFWLMNCLLVSVYQFFVVFVHPPLSLFHLRTHTLSLFWTLAFLNSSNFDYFFFRFCSLLPKFLVWKSKLASKISVDLQIESIKQTNEDKNVNVNEN